MKGYYAARALYYDDVYNKPERAEDIAHLKVALREAFHGRTFAFRSLLSFALWTTHRPVSPTQKFLGPNPDYPRADHRPRPTDLG